MTSLFFDPSFYKNQLNSTDAKKAKAVLLRIDNLVLAIILTVSSEEKTLLISQLDVLTTHLICILKRQASPELNLQKIVIDEPDIENEYSFHDQIHQNNTSNYDETFRNNTLNSNLKKDYAFNDKNL